MRNDHFRFLDIVKTVACNLIVLHHLAFYGPMADHAKPLLPGLMDWLESEARVAVHVFLAIGGFLAAKSLTSQMRVFGRSLQETMRVVLRRFIKLVPPFIVAMGLAVIASVIAGEWMTHDSISAPPTLAQFAAHFLLLHGILGFESLSAGAWYVAIDFQLYVSLALLLWLSARIGGAGMNWLAMLLVMVGCGASLMYFNLDADWDVWAPYFFGSYGLGALAWWAATPKRGPVTCAVIAALMLLLGGVALEFDFRSRIAVALATSLAMIAAYRCSGILMQQRFRALESFGKISYAVFLIHFPVCLVVNAAFTRFTPHEPAVQLMGVLTAWVASIAAGAAFHRWIEQPLGRFVKLEGRRTHPSPQTV